MNPYRESPEVQLILGPRWGVTRWKKLYVRCARVFIDLRSKYAYQRQYNQYKRELADWHFKWSWPAKIPPSFERYKYLKKHRPPMPLPPPIHINE